jgi:hypothetical protein
MRHHAADLPTRISTGENAAFPVIHRPRAQGRKFFSVVRGLRLPYPGMTCCAGIKRVSTHALEDAQAASLKQALRVGMERKNPPGYEGTTIKNMRFAP